MPKHIHRPAPRSAALVATRPRPTSGAALLFAVLLSLPFAAWTLLQAVLP